jgi:16S rRNA processing protein RimM
LKLSNDKDALENALLVGEVVGLHGLRGVLKLRSYADSPAFFAPGLRLQMETLQGQAISGSVAWAKPHGKGLLLALEGVDDRKAAEAFVGCRLHVSKAALPELEEGTYYWFELIGLSVRTTQGRYLGTLSAIVPTGSNDVYVVRNGDDEILVPALASVVQMIDRSEGRMEVTLPEGL